MKKPQWITVAVAVLLTAGIFIFGRTVPRKKPVVAAEHGPNDGHNHDAELQPISTDSILAAVKKRLDPQQALRLNALENSVKRGDVQDQQVQVYHQLARFWLDSARIFEPYAFYTGEAARLENSEKSLTFAAQLFLDNLQGEDNLRLRQWKALQAKDLFERSLKINPANDSARVGLGACYLFGSISSAPMQGITEIRGVVQKDSTNIYAQMMLVRGSLLSGQYDKAISRLQTVLQMQPGNIEALLLMGDVYERMGDKKAAAGWYEKSLPYVAEPKLKAAIRERIEDLRK